MISNIYCHVRCAKHCSKCFIHICSFKPLKSYSVGTIITPHIKDDVTETQTANSNQLTVIWLVSGGVRFELLLGLYNPSTSPGDSAFSLPSRGSDLCRCVVGEQQEGSFKSTQIQRPTKNKDTAYLMEKSIISEHNSIKNSKMSSYQKGRHL